ncbi:metal ABC transporter solute-binding protein, Zn/Mn family [Neisseria bacilliformis]|uniref:metal ABC transporter solute-binding protein, Zn/Mn family n=1 Tax=Neisseria bacilliformis TaxID=267212 RepID=UPI0028F1533A|nr:zinc ABC transporter substrate-binding protein [Neisseria bacilliformis]
MKHWKPAFAALLAAGIAHAEPLNVVSSFSILGDVAKQVGGDKVAVTNLVGADQDSHVYRLTSGDIKKIRAAKLVLLNGLGFESAEMARAVKQSKIPYAEAAAGIKAMEADHDHDEHEHEHGHDHDHGGHEHHHHGQFDPHVWSDPSLMQKYAANVAEAFIKADPQNKAYYSQRLQNYGKELQQLDAYAKGKFDAVPAARRKVLTGHEAFGYMGRRYNIKFYAPQGINTEAEPSAKHVAALIRQVKQEGIKAVFAENIKDSRMLERIAKESGSKIGGKLYSDALSKNPPADTYTGMMRHNIDALANAMK